MHTLRMDFPGKNALSTELLTWLLAELDAAAGQPGLLTGTEGAFSEGLNLKESASLEDAGVADAERPQRFETLELPVGNSDDVKQRVRAVLAGQ